MGCPTASPALRDVGNQGQMFARLPAEAERLGTSALFAGNFAKSRNLLLY